MCGWGWGGACDLNHHLSQPPPIILNHHLSLDSPQIKLESLESWWIRSAQVLHPAVAQGIAIALSKIFYFICNGSTLLCPVFFRDTLFTADLKKNQIIQMT